MPLMWISSIFVSVFLFLVLVVMYCYKYMYMFNVSNLLCKKLVGSKTENKLTIMM